MKKSIFFWLYFVVSIILAIYFAVRIITSQMGRGPVSHVHNIETYGANAKDKEIIKLRFYKEKTHQIIDNENLLQF